jgi:hypothetical protein
MVKLMGKVQTDTGLQALYFPFYECKNAWDGQMVSVRNSCCTGLQHSICIFCSLVTSLHRDAETCVLASCPVPLRRVGKKTCLWFRVQKEPYYDLLQDSAVVYCDNRYLKKIYCITEISSEN